MKPDASSLSALLLKRLDWMQSELMESRTGTGSAGHCHPARAGESTQSQGSHLSQTEGGREGEKERGRRRERGGGVVELVPNVWWQAVARK